MGNPSFSGSMLGFGGVLYNMFSLFAACRLQFANCYPPGN